MQILKHLMATVALASLMGTTALADKALLLGVPEDRTRVLGTRIGDISGTLRDGGYTVIEADARSINVMHETLSRMLNRIDDEQRVLFYLNGSFVRSGNQTWLIAGNTNDRPDLATIGRYGLSVDTVLEIAARIPGGAIVLLGDTEDAPDLGDALVEGFARFDIPQGVSVIQGRADDIARFASNGLLDAEVGLKTAIDGADGLTVRGFVSDRVVAITETGISGGEIPPVAPQAAEVERAIWEATQAQDTVEAYEGYVRRYPNGQFADEARKLIAAIEAEPFRVERLAEEGLNLNRDARREIQRDLTILNYKPRGIDGIFGNGTRAAVERFQTKNGFPKTGFLNDLQIRRLSLQAEQRTAELEAEAERRRLDAERQDTAYWNASGRAGDEAGLRTYLKRYPDGLFSDVAQQGLDKFEAEKRAAAEAEERAAWEAAREAGTEDAYQRYLNSFPRGAFVADAQASLAALRQDDSSERQAAEKGESALHLPGISRVLIEKRLDQLGLEPGPADGTFDDNTRKAIRRFQRDRSLDITGYLNEQTLVRILADVGITIQRN
ncbi:peptidoglycan-binding domain-containing protein [Actibacterium sp. 188UL27-1]|uniref:peptidoglycan-binding domain-containing protein n=1 Tax=Actibacterium sp. 188UL27-1 TaxID=2786961 RepID=UPI00195DB5EA|nr:peptidoglycan-binding domain-containing protein [Actibacterium sp. 188UL27-1]MBM7070091.1 peptidoglycan-binding protein [Actibacterium sp. 188UL27-1]